MQHDPMLEVLGMLEDVKADLQRPEPQLADPIDIIETAAELADSLGLNNGETSAAFAEVRRITQMRIQGDMTPEEKEHFDRTHIQAAAYKEGFRHFDIQAWAWSEFEQTNSGFYPIGVGWGKTLVSLATAQTAYIRGSKRVMLIIPPGVLDQLVTHDIKWLRTRIPLQFPIHVLAGRGRVDRKAMCRAKKHGLYIYTYSLLSREDGAEVLEDLEPETIVCDEAHELARKDSAKTRRFLEFVEQAQPNGVCMSGTMTAASIMDYYHLIKWCLGKNNPLPNSPTLAQDWASHIDAKAIGIDDDGDQDYVVPQAEAAPRSKYDPLRPLIEWAQRWFPEQKIQDKDVASYRRAYKLRLHSTPGVAASSDAEIGSSLVLQIRAIKNYKSTPGWEQLEDHIKNIDEAWLTPNGDEIEYAIHKFKWHFELTAGFYNELTWPTAEAYAERKNIGTAEAEDILEQAIEHHTLGQEHARKLRKYLELGVRGLDTPLLVWSHAKRHLDDPKTHRVQIDDEVYETWLAWHQADFEGRPDRDSRAIRVCDYKIQNAVEWAKEHKAGIIWFHNIEIGQWLRESMYEAGVDHIFCPAGKNVEIRDPANKDKIAIASLSGHGTGKNLQHWYQSLYVQFPRSPKTAEQSLGRMHRNGQKRDEVQVTLNSTTLFDEQNFASCLNDALYIQQTTGNRQKAVYCRYDPLPKVFPPAVLNERGLNTKLLDAEARRVMREKFGAN